MKVYAFSTGDANPNLCDWSFDEDVAVMLYQAASANSMFDARDLIHFALDVDLNKFSESFMNAIRHSRVTIKAFRPAVVECELKVPSLAETAFPKISDYTFCSDSPSSREKEPMVVMQEDQSMIAPSLLQLRTTLTPACVGMR